MHTWIIQASSINAYFSTVNYVGSNLFIVIPQFEISFPTCIGQLESFTKDLGKLFTFQEDIENLAHTADTKLQIVRDDCRFILRPNPLLIRPYKRPQLLVGIPHLEIMSMTLLFQI